MQSRENRNISQELNKEKYKEEIRRLEKSKEKMIETGLFDKYFIDSLEFFILVDGDSTDVDSDLRLCDDGSVVPYEVTDRTRETPILSELYMNSINSQFEIASERNKSQHLWFGNLDMSVFISYDAAAAHETAHTKSYRVIDRNEFSQYDGEKFKKIIEELIKNDSDLSNNTNIDINKFDYWNKDGYWSELYALLYHREFLRRENCGNNKMIKEWDEHIVTVANDLYGAMEKFNKEKGININPEIIYDDCHAFSFILARVFEEKYKDFDERIKVLETCKKA